MSYGISSLRRIQLGRESTPGTAIAASTVWRGEGVLEDTRLVNFPVENIGLIPITTRSYQPLYGGRITLSPTPATFEQLPHLFEMGIKSVAGSSDGLGSGYIYNYTLPVSSSQAMYVTPSTSSNPIKTYTIEGGDNNQSEVMDFSFVQDITLDFKAGESVMMSASLAGSQVVVSTAGFTSSTIAAVPNVSEILTSKGKIYIDSSTGTIGTTQITNEILSGSVKITTGLRGVPTADGTLRYSFIKGVRPELILTLKFEHSTFAKLEKSLWRSGTPRLCQINFEGPALTTAGTTYSTKRLIINVAGTYEKFSSLEDSEGDDTITATLRCGYNSTSALFANIIVVNELSAIP